jgi:hypothetical protein
VSISGLGVSGRGKEGFSSSGTDPVDRVVLEGRTINAEIVVEILMRAIKAGRPPRIVDQEANRLTASSVAGIA